MSNATETSGKKHSLTFEELELMATVFVDALEDFTPESRCMVLGSVLSFTIRNNESLYKKTLAALKASFEIGQDILGVLAESVAKVSEERAKEMN